jgi:hypothetical protein
MGVGMVAVLGWCFSVDWLLSWEMECFAAVYVFSGSYFAQWRTQCNDVLFANAVASPPSPSRYSCNQV